MFGCEIDYWKASRKDVKLAKGKKLTDQAVKSSPKALHCTNCGIDDEASRKGATLARMQLKYNLAQSRRAAKYFECLDVFTLIKDEQGWRIASVSYTVEREGCR